MIGASTGCVYSVTDSSGNIIRTLCSRIGGCIAIGAYIANSNKCEISKLNQIKPNPVDIKTFTSYSITCCCSSVVRMNVGSTDLQLPFWVISDDTTQRMRIQTVTPLDVKI